MLTELSLSLNVHFSVPSNSKSYPKIFVISNFNNRVFSKSVTSSRFHVTEPSFFSEANFIKVVSPPMILSQII